MYVALRMHKRNPHRQLRGQCPRHMDGKEATKRCFFQISFDEGDGVASMGPIWALYLKVVQNRG
jgi:hypothetical protein